MLANEPLKCYVRREWRGARGLPMSEWWVFFTYPLVYSVWWQQDGTKTMKQFLDEQVELARAHGETAVT